jgi:hypothetical protein
MGRLGSGRFIWDGKGEEKRRRRRRGSIGRRGSVGGVGEGSLVEGEGRLVEEVR